VLLEQRVRRGAGGGLPLRRLRLPLSACWSLRRQASLPLGAPVGLQLEASSVLLFFDRPCDLFGSHHELISFSRLPQALHDAFELGRGNASIC
jgi:hypothetical protein